MQQQQQQQQQHRGRLAGKVCIVTGSSSGLGRAIALAYAREGADLVCADLRPNALADVEAETVHTTDELIRQQGGRAVFVKTDVSQSEQMRDLVRRAVEEYGRVDVMVNNAGVSMENTITPSKMHEMPDEVWDKSMAINARSVFLGCKYAAAQMLKQDPHPSGDRGWIINMSSIFGLVGAIYGSTYAASKGAVANLTRSVALDYADSRIHCNAICPGFTETAMFANTIKIHDRAGIAARHPFGGTGKPEDIAGVAVFLASDDARWVTGVCMPVDGGFTAQ
ncbi:hypothetical protein ANO11243_071700 [Dothideomycetidae sp. 11243]|nr:hypothetical protein ANO11243_071700 [fungal sp. No.11243]